MGRQPHHLGDRAEDIKPGLLVPLHPVHGKDPNRVEMNEGNAGRSREETERVLKALWSPDP